MTKHFVINLCFGISVVCLIVAGHFYSISYAWYIVLLLLYLSVTALGSYFIGLDFFIVSYNRGNAAAKLIALTFDDGPHTDYTAQVLDILKSNKAPATFFLIGKNIIGNEATLKRMTEEGHVIGNHSFYHTFWFSIQSATQISNEIKQTQTEIENLIGKKPLFFRPPYGVTNPMVASAINKSSVYSMGWGLRSYDTSIHEPNKLLRRLKKNLKNGDIILLHDHSTATLSILSDFISYVRSQEFEIVGLDKLLGIKAYE